jgi:thioredoxin-related protein
MKKIIISILLLPFTLVADLNWASSYEDGLAQAKSENKIAMIMFTTKTCKMCNYMKDVVYEDEKVMEYVENFFIPIEVDIDEHPQKYGYKVFGTPTYYFLTSDAKQIGRLFMGGAKPDGFVTKLKEVVKESK